MLELEQQIRTLKEGAGSVAADPGMLWKNPVRWSARNLFLPPVFKTGFNVLEYEHLEESLDELGNLWDENTLLVAVMKHVSHSDILAAIKLAKRTRLSVPQIDNFYFPVAASLVRGVQGFFPQLLYSEGTLPLLEQPNIIPLSAVTDNDKNHRGLKPTGAELKRIMRAATEPKSAILDLAEGTVEGGRFDVLGHERGMQHVTNSFLPFVFREAFRVGKRVVVLPAGITGTNQMLSAESLFLTWRGVGALLEDWVLEEPPLLGKVKVGSPYEFQNPGFDLLEHTQEINDQIMYSVAELVPILERGYYHPLTREYQTEIKAFERNFIKANGRLQLDLLRLGIIPLPAELIKIAEKFPQIPYDQAT